MSNNKTIAIGCDHAGFILKDPIVQLLKEEGIEVHDFGTYSEDSVDYPDFVHPVADMVESGKARLGIVICGSGNGVAMTANKHQGIRAALCWTEEIASLARQHNDANVIALPARFVTQELALTMVRTFIHTDFEGGRHERRVGKIACS
jgi:ribose 5-phosphate isomerase B